MQPKQERELRRAQSPVPPKTRAQTTEPGIDSDDVETSKEARTSIGLMKAVEHPGEFSPPPEPGGKAPKGSKRG